MNRFSKPVCIAILAYILPIVVLGANAQPIPAKAGPEVLIETMEVQVNADALQKLRISSPAPKAEVTASVAKLLWLLTDPNNSKLLDSAKIKVQSGKTGIGGTGKKLKYLARTNADSFTEKLTDEAVGTTVEASPSIGRRMVLTGIFPSRTLAAFSK